VDERLFARLAALLQQGAVVVASVVDTQGAVPRHRGARMIVTRHMSDASIGGGLAEARAIAAARKLLDDASAPRALELDLRGKPSDAGVCGGTMRVALRRWAGEADIARADEIAAQLARGEDVALSADDLGVAGVADTARPDERLLIVGGGHCALALHDFASQLDYDIWVYDDRTDCFGKGQFAGASVLSGSSKRLREALWTTRETCVVLLNRDFQSDVAALRVVAESVAASGRAPKFLGMMGSQRRIAEVRRALGKAGDALGAIVAPVGFDIAAETPHEIAVAILAQLVSIRRGPVGAT
jgi:xanthine dehydrogenase accessory factor